MSKLDKSIPAKERFKMIAKMWSDVKPAKAVKPVKAKAVKAKGGSLNDIHDLSDDDEPQQKEISIIERLKPNAIKRGGYQGFQGHYPDAINESILQQLIKKN